MGTGEETVRRNSIHLFDHHRHHHHHCRHCHCRHKIIEVRFMEENFNMSAIEFIALSAVHSVVQARATLGTKWVSHQYHHHHHHHHRHHHHHHQ